MRETDMYGAIKEYFEKDGYLVRSEVRSIDVVAVKDELLVGIEMKRGLTMDLLVQGTLRQKTCDLVYLAVPKPKRIVKDKGMNNLLYLLKRLELGLLYVDVEKNAVLEVQEPLFYDLNKGRRSSLKERMRILKETGRRSLDGNQGGSTGKKLLTAYREESLRAVALMKLNEVISVAQQINSKNLLAENKKGILGFIFSKLKGAKQSIHEQFSTTKEQMDTRVKEVETSQTGLKLRVDLLEKMFLV